MAANKMIKIVAVWGSKKFDAGFMHNPREEGWLRARDADGNCWIYSGHYGLASCTEKHPTIQAVVKAIRERGWINSGWWTIEERFEDMPHELQMDAIGSSVNYE